MHFCTVKLLKWVFKYQPNGWNVVVQFLSYVQLFETPWTVTHEASLSFTISGSLLKLMSIKSVMPSNLLILCHPLLLLPSISVIPFSSCLQSFPASGSFLMSLLFASDSQSTGASASAWILPMNIQDWFPLELTGWISLLSKGLSTGFSNTTTSDFIFTIRHIHNWALFLLWLSLFIPSGAISLLFSSSILGT